jgi:hypothetical protein
LNGELIHLSYQRLSPSTRSHVVVELPNVSTFIDWQRPSPAHRPYRAAFMTCSCSTLRPILTTPESFYGSPVHNPCPALTPDSAINHTCLAVDGRKSCTNPPRPPTQSISPTLITSTSSKHSCLHIHIIDCVHRSLYTTRLGSIASSTSAPWANIINIPGLTGLVLPH